MKFLLYLYKKEIVMLDIFKKKQNTKLFEIEVGSLFTLKMEVTLNLNVHTKISI